MPESDPPRAAACGICIDRFGNSAMGDEVIMLPAHWWRVGPHNRVDPSTGSTIVTDKPTPICAAHREAGDVEWKEGCKTYLAWYVMSK